MRLIDADAIETKLRKCLRKLASRPDLSASLCYVGDMVAEAPTIEAEPVRHGAWIEDGYNGNPFVCSYCGHEGCYSGAFNNKQYYYTNYCPYCGAKMDKENEK